jgi:hypothetical protein
MAAAPPDPIAVIALLLDALSRQAAPGAVDWLRAEIDHQRGSDDPARLARAFGMAGRRIGRDDLAISDEQGAAARRLRPQWQPEGWSADEAARVALLLATHRGDDTAFAARIDRLAATAGVTELAAILKGFAVFPAPRALYARAREGVRSAITPVLAAIACRNPYPFDYFDAAAWNQMVVKCVFGGIAIDTIAGLSERRNSEVVQMLRDLVSERHAAGRTLPDAVHAYVAEQ